MKEFDENNENNEIKKLVVELHKKFSHQVFKYMNKHNKKSADIVLTALQSAVTNFIGSITASCAETNKDINKQLDYIEAVRHHLNQKFDIIRVKLKSNQLN